MERDQPTIAVDFDGVIADYDGWQGETVHGPPRADVIDALNRLRAEGWRIIVYSSRAESEITPYLVDNCVPYDEVNRNSLRRTGGAKPVANVYWDDRAYRYTGDARKDVEEIRNFRTWSGRL